MDKYNMDTHKLMYHPKIVSDWLDEKQIYPMYVEISLTSACNHRCVFCAPRYFLNYKPVFLNTLIIKDTLTNMAKVGVKAVMFGGEGENLLHPDFIEIVAHAKDCGLDIGITTNGIFFNRRNAEDLLPKISWVKFSVDAGDVKTYSYLHGTKPLDFKTILDNISRASFTKRLRKYDVDIGVQAILFENNIETLPQLIKVLICAKPDYFVVKPYSEHSQSINKDLKPPTKEQLDKFLLDVESLMPENKAFEFIYRNTAISLVDKEKDYKKCYGKDFVAYIDALGGVYSCCNYLGNKDFCYGDIHHNSFEDIWRNKQEIHPNLSECRNVCRIDNINRYLWKLKTGDIKHKYFI